MGDYCWVVMREGKVKRWCRVKYFVEIIKKGGVFKYNVILNKIKEGGGYIYLLVIICLIVFVKYKESVSVFLFFWLIFIYLIFVVWLDDFD